MRLEQLDLNKIKIFIPFDDLSDRGLTKDKIWHDIPEVHQLFRDMMSAANQELGFQIDGPIKVNVFSLQAQGMVIIISKSQSEELSGDQQEQAEHQYIEMQVTIDENHEYLYAFNDIEHIIPLARRLYELHVSGGQLLFYQGCYYLNVIEDDLQQFDKDTKTLIALLSEYGTPATITSHQLQEYGQFIMQENAVADLCHYFS